MTWSVLDGDCLERLADLDDDSIDAVVTDPPYGLEFMGKDWDAPWKGDVVKDPASVGGFQDGNGGNPYSRSRIRYGIGHGFQQWTEAWATELLRVLKPGGHLLAFGGTRTYHRLASGIEDAGFEIRDCLAWHYGSGFPKSLDVSKAIDKAAGAEREVVGKYQPPNGSKWNLRQANESSDDHSPGTFTASGTRTLDLTAPATDLARQWQGWGTALKPAFEPIILARKPLIGTVAENVTRFGTGGLNVDGCRVGTTVETWPSSRSYAPGQIQPGGKGKTEQTGPTPPGRWPANLVLDDQAAAMLDEQSGDRPATGTPDRPATPGTTDSGGYGDWAGNGFQGPLYSDTGGASRFFYQAKASRAERNAGLGEQFEVKRPDSRDEVAAGHFHEKGIQPQKNSHPTVKPIDLMRWLVRLVTPPGGTVLDPFTGSGTTGIAAGLEGFDFVGIEREAEYREIAEARLRWWGEQDGETAEILQRAGLAKKERAKAEAAGQTSLFEGAA